MCVQNITRPCPANANTLKRSPTTLCRSTRYPSDVKCDKRNSPISLSVPVTEGMVMSFFVSSNGFISALSKTYVRARRSRARAKIRAHRKENEQRHQGRARQTESRNHQ